jgi:hypothetical protein
MSSATSMRASSLMDWVTLTISPRPRRILTISAGGRSILSANSLTVIPRWNLIGPSSIAGASSSAAATGSTAGFGSAFGAGAGAAAAGFGAGAGFAAAG